MQTETLTIEKMLNAQKAQDAGQLFELYNSHHFIYPAKMEKLSPVFDIVKQNWQKAVKMGFPLFCVTMVNKNCKNITATATRWQYLNRGMIGQHLASNNPVGSRVVFLSVLNKMIEEQHKGHLESFQIYYRPQNKYSDRMFGKVSAKAGNELSETIPYNYFEVPLLHNGCAGYINVTEIDRSDGEFIDFLMEERSALFIKTQELDSDDINLDRLDNKFRHHGLRRRRKIFVARNSHNNKICGAIIVNQSSLGLNFSFFENSSELILDSRLCREILLDAAHSLISRASHLHLMSPLKFLPVLSDPVHTSIIEKLHGKLTRNYNLFIILRGGYEIWYRHIDELTSSIYQRFISNVYEKIS
jgi:hypothetical protein